jgi:hypothetical protein
MSQTDALPESVKAQFKAWGAQGGKKTGKTKNRGRAAYYRRLQAASVAARKAKAHLQKG